MLYGPDGRSASKMTWDQFSSYERWDEFPERVGNPPMTVDFAFWYQEHKYYCTGENYGYVIVDETWHRIAYDTNFLNLLKQPIFNNRSFYDAIADILFID